MDYQYPTKFLRIRVALTYPALYLFYLVSLLILTGGLELEGERQKKTGYGGNRTPRFA